MAGLAAGATVGGSAIGSAAYREDMAMEEAPLFSLYIPAPTVFASLSYCGAHSTEPEEEEKQSRKRKLNELLQKVSP